VVTIALLLTYGIFTGSWTFIAVIVIGVPVYFYGHREKPVQRTMRIWDEGFAIGDSYTPWTRCKGFWFIDDEGYTELLIEHGKRLREHSCIHTENLSKEKIRGVMERFLPEFKDRKRHPLDRIAHFCKI
jgi:hypothetical protein